MVERRSCVWGPSAAGTLLVEVRDQMIQPQQKENTNPKANDRRQEGPGPCPGGLIHGGDQQLQIDAATMTPEAKPVSPRCTRSPKPFFRKKTQADPSEVPTKGISRP